LKREKSPDKTSIMAKLVFKMRNVPDDEALEVRELLEANEIEYFETFAGNWGMSMPALWVKHDQQFSEARRLIDEYQGLRAQRIKSEYESQRARGDTRTMWHSFLEDPFRFTAVVIGIGLVLYFSLRFFLTL
jgi:hypothetical protein